MKKITLSLSNIRFSALSLLMVVGLFFASSAYAADITYAVATGDWTDANWTPQAPVAGDNIIIPTGAILTVSTDLSATIFNKVTVNEGGKLIISATGNLNIQQTIALTTVLNIVGGEVSNAGTLTIKQTLANTSTVPLQFSENVNVEGKFTNTGTLLIDNTASSNSSTSGKCISFTQTSQISRMKFGGTMTFNSKTGARFIEVMSAAKVEFDGTAVIGSSSDYKNFRLMHFGSSCNVTIAPTADITFYSGFAATNGAITFSNNQVVQVTNKGKLTIFGGSAVTGYGIYINPQLASTLNGTSTFTNEGTLIIDGNFPLGCIYLNGTNTSTLATFTNTLGATSTLRNTGVAATAVPIRASATLPTVLTNAGTMNVSNTAMDASIGTSFNTYTNTGTVNFSFTTAVDNFSDIKGNVYANNQNIYVNLASDASVQLQLTDMTGRLIKQIAVKGQNNVINTTGLKGIYIVRLFTSEGNYSQKVSL